jgi:hypothetical protein
MSKTTLKEQRRTAAARQHRLGMILGAIEQALESIAYRQAASSKADELAVERVTRWTEAAALTLPERKITGATVARAERTIRHLVLIKRYHWRRVETWGVREFAGYLRACSWLAWVALDDDSSRPWRFLCTTLHTLAERFERACETDGSGFAAAGEMIGAIMETEERRAA